MNAAGQVEPYLAQSITSNADFTAFTITLRPGIVFHDGTPLDANALHLNIEKPATSILTGPAFADHIAGASVTGPLSVTITMKTSWAPFPYYLAQAQTGLRRRAVHAEQPERHVTPRSAPAPSSSRSGSPTAT